MPTKAGKYDYLILDEAQVMKNTQTRLLAIYVIFCFHIVAYLERLLKITFGIWSISNYSIPGLLPTKLLS